MRSVLLRISLFFLHSTALLALLPLVARALPGGNAGTFTALIASMGVGAIVAAVLMPRIRAWMPLAPRLLAGTAIEAAAAVAVAYAPGIGVAVPAMMICGASIT